MIRGHSYMKTRRTFNLFQNGKQIPLNSWYLRSPLSRGMYEDLEDNLKAFRVRMVISRGSNTILCKLIVRTFTRVALQQFSKILDGVIDSFQKFFWLWSNMQQIRWCLHGLSIFFMWNRGRMDMFVKPS